MFYEKGYVETTLQDIADEMGFTKPAVYYYAKNKEEILVELYDQIVTAAIDSALEISQRDESGAVRFVALAQHHLSTFLEHIEANAVFEVQRTSLSPDAKQKMQALAREYNGILAGVYQQGIVDGSLTPMEPRIAINAVLGMCNTVHRWFNPRGGVPPEALIATIISLISGGLVTTKD